MRIAFRVHRLGLSPVQVEATVNGEPMTATISRLEVELADDSGQHGSALLRFTSSAEIAEAREKFVLDQTVEITI